jgi:biotin carboxyl carrier protein
MPTDPQAHTQRVEIVARRPELRVRVAEREYDVVDQGSEEIVSVLIDGEVHRGFRFVDRDRIWVRTAGRTFVVERVNPIAAATGGKGSSKGELVSDMPGTVVAVHVKEGDHVAAGDALLTIESMKLQITVGAERDGVVARIAVEPNATFDRGALLAIVRAEEAAQ